jgi:hypothetical protein
MVIACDDLLVKPTVLIVDVICPELSGQLIYG